MVVIRLLVATTGDKAALGSITSGPRHYAQWRDPYPLTEDELAERLRLASTQVVTQQDILAGVVMHPSRMLDIVHNYVTFMRADDGTMIKAVPRYQQYRAVEKAVDRLLNGQTRSRSSDDQDHRGGGEQLGAWPAGAHPPLQHSEVRAWTGQGDDLPVQDQGPAPRPQPPAHQARDRQR